MIRLRSISSQVMLPALVSMTLLAVLLGGIFAWTGANRLQAEFNARGSAIARQIAPALSYPISAGFESDLHHYLAATVQERDVVVATVYNNDNQAIFRINRKGFEPGSETDRAHIARFSATVFEPNLIFDDYGHKDRVLSTNSTRLKRGRVEVIMDSSNLRNDYRRLLVETALLSLAVLTLSALLLTQLTRRVIRSITATTQTVERLEFGDLKARATLSDIDELRTLQSGINDMARALDESQESMRTRVDLATGRLVNTVNELERSEARYRDLFENATDGVFMLNRNLRIVDSNSSMDKLASTTDVTMAGRSLLDCLAPSQAQRVRKFYTLQSDEAVARTFEISFVNGQRLVEISSRPIFSEGRIVGFHGIARDTTQRHRIQNALRKARAEAEKANLAKTTFLASVSHEIRTPMNGILGFLGLLQKTGLNETQADYIDTAQLSATSLLRIIDDLLDSATSEIGQLQFEPKSVELRPFLDHIIRAHRPLADQNNIELISEIGPELPFTVVTDPDRLRQILSNLLTNALKFINKGRVVLRVNAQTTDTSAQLAFSVEDTGIGIASDDLERIFRPFERASNSLNREFAGIGLGLNIAHRLVQLLGGRMDIDSEVGKGTSVHVRATFFLGDSQESTTQLSMTAPRIPAIPLPASVYAQNSSAVVELLVVDDSRINTTFVETLLNLYGANVTTCASGQHAIAECESKSFDLIFMDVHMPDMDGFEATARIRNMLGNHCPPVVALTADSSSATRARLDAVDVDEVILKPVNEQMLVDVVNRLTRGHLQWRNVANTPAASVTRSPVAGVIDSARGIELAGGDRTVWESNVRLLAKDIHTRLPALKAVAPTRCEKALFQHAHRIAGSAAYIGARNLERDARAVEVAAQDGTEIDAAQRALTRSAAQFISYVDSNFVRVP